ncbi:hypothetical protein SKAU_G00337670 [Synaphobranchus kaupii]|uniref:Uncharacterized protein n=1 Tax=Synaphobranchus kaupii TaxID=118154 RepID=A0A9Q1IJ46_SYNKA|nr:hypothetical protein SKAU_G00337670 [Synaphobranchus kaupii]
MCSWPHRLELLEELVPASISSDAGWPTGRCTLKVGSRGAATSWWTDAPHSGRPDCSHVFKSKRTDSLVIVKTSVAIGTEPIQLSRYPSGPTEVLSFQGTPLLAQAVGCLNSRPCKNTYCCAARTLPGAYWTSLASLNERQHSITDPVVSQGAIWRSVLCQMGALERERVTPRDFHHTRYCLSGLSIAQHFKSRDVHHELILGKEEKSSTNTPGLQHLPRESSSSA